MNNRWYQITLVTLFIVVLSLPLAASFLQRDMGISAIEKRKLAGRPALPSSLEGLTTYPERFEKYYEDNFGFREPLIATYNWLYLKLLAKSPTPRVTVGKQGWLFFNDDHTLDDFLGLRPISTDTLEQWRRVITDRNEWLADRGIVYLPVIIPYKMMIYPDKMPSRIQKRSSITALDQLMSYLSKFGQKKEILDLRTPLLEARKTRQVYFKTDTHWNPDGAFTAYGAMLDRIKIGLPAVNILRYNDMVPQHVRHAGDITMLLHLSETLSEEAVRYDMLSPCSTGYTKLHDYIHPQQQFANNEVFLPVKNGCAERPLSALVIHDSFGLFLRPYLNESFGKVIYSNYADFGDLKELIHSHQPDLVIDSRVARNINSMLKPDKSIEDELLKKHIAGPGKIYLLVDKTSGLKKVTQLHQLTISPHEEGHTLLADGNDPFLTLAAEPGADGKQLITEIVLTSPEDTTLQLFYTMPGQQHFEPAKALSIPVVKGHNHLFARLPHGASSKKFRLDPGRVPGRYTLHSLLVKAEK